MLEEQTTGYTSNQRTQHLLARLRLALPTAMATYHGVPPRRQDLVTLAIRLESWPAKRLTGGTTAHGKRPRGACLLDNLAEVNIIPQGLVVQL